MKIRFSRSTFSSAAGREAEASLPAALFIVWEKEHPFADGIEFQRIHPDLFQARAPYFGDIFLSRTPWWTELPEVPSGSGLWLSYQGVRKGVWQDGINGRFQGGCWTDLVLPGPAFALELGRSTLAIDDVEDFWHEEKHCSQKQSLIECIRFSFGPRIFEPTVVKFEPNLDGLLGLLLLRLAFPSSPLGVFVQDVRWKRLAQNLNIEPLREGSLGRELSLPQNFGPQTKVLELLLWQQTRSPFIPQNLLASLSEQETS